MPSKRQSNLPSILYSCTESKRPACQTMPPRYGSSKKPDLRERAMRGATFALTAAGRIICCLRSSKAIFAVPSSPFGGGCELFSPIAFTTQCCKIMIGGSVASVRSLMVLAAAALALAGGSIQAAAFDTVAAPRAVLITRCGCSALLSRCLLESLGVSPAVAGSRVGAHPRASRSRMGAPFMRPNYTYSHA